MGKYQSRFRRPHFWWIGGEAVIYLFKKFASRLRDPVGRAFERRRQLARKHCYLPHRSHFGARNGCSGLLGCCQCARKSCSGLLRCRRCARNGRSGLSLPRCCRCARKGCSGLLWRRQCPQNGRSRLLWLRQRSQKGCLSPLRCRQRVQSGCSRLLFEITI